MIVLALVAALTGSSSTAMSAGGREGAPTVRGAAVQGQTLFGLNVPSLKALDGSESALRARSAIVGTFADWEHTSDFPVALAEDVNDRGAVPLISWEPWDWDGGTEQPAYALRRILAGDHDGLIDRWATQVAAYRRPVLLRFAPEMNGDWRPWSTGLNGNQADEYVATWRHVRERFLRAGPPTRSGSGTRSSPMTARPHWPNSSPGPTAGPARVYSSPDSVRRTVR